MKSSIFYAKSILNCIVEIENLESCAKVIS